MVCRRLGFDAVRAVRNATGLGNYARRTLQALRAHDARLEMQLYSSRLPRPEWANFPAQLGARLRVPPQPSTPLSRAVWRTFELGRRAARDHVQVFHGLSHEIPRDLPGTRIPGVVTFHDLIFEREPRRFSMIDRWSYRWRYRWSARHAAAIVAVSNHTRNDLIEQYGIDASRVVVIPTPLDESFATPVPASERERVTRRYQLPSVYLLSVGTVEPRKNHRVLIEALATLPETARVPLIIAGRDGGALAQLRRLVRQRGLLPTVRFITPLPDTDLCAVLQGAAALLYPSVSEGFGLPIAEALSAGVPVLAASGGHLNEAGGNAASYVDPHDAAAWAAAWTALLDDPARAAVMRQAGQAWVVRFTGSLLAARLRNVYDAVLAGDPLPNFTDVEPEFLH